MSDLDALTVRAIAESAQSAATLAEHGNRSAAETALARAHERLALFEQGRPGHSRHVRVARESVAQARRAVEAMIDHRLTAREKTAAARAASRAATRAKA